MSESVVVVCPDTNIRLWPNRMLDAPIGGGKSAILQLAYAWARAGHEVTIAGALVTEGQAQGVCVRHIERSAGNYDVAIYVTGSRGHFDEPDISRITSRTRVLWMNSPNRVSLPPGPVPDLFIAPAKFLARRAIDEWGFPADRIVVIPGEAVSGMPAPEQCPRDDLAIVYASHPFKGLNHAVDVIGRLVPDYPGLHLDVYGSAKLHGDDLDDSLPGGYPDWVNFKGAASQRRVESVMTRYGAMLYLTEWLDGFSLATAEALAGGVIVIATDHGSNAELIRHGWNGLLVSSDDSHKPNLEQAEELMRCYLASPATSSDMRRRAAASVATWDDQAAEWERTWRTNPIAE